MRILAVSTKKRYAALPNVPTIAETVLPEFDALAWYALAGPKGLPAPVLAKLNEAAHAALKRPDIASRIASQGAEVWGTGPGEAQAFLRSEVTRWTKVIRDENVQAQ
jgi:tripartite-type tricarboxylate transporter receptor subunit TctC